MFSAMRCSASMNACMRRLVTCALSEKTSTCVGFTSKRSIACRRWMSSQAEKPKKEVKAKTGPVSWKSFLITAGVGTGLILFMWQVKKEKELRDEAERTKQVGKVSLGGDWELVNHHGKPTSNKDYAGQWCLLYFGFCHCPDICPDELDKMAEVVDLVDGTPASPNLIPLYITVDPARDDVDAVAEYVKDFSPKLVGLTGTEEQIRKITRAFRVYFSQGPKDDDNDYIVDHSIVMYLIDPEGKFLDYYGQNKTQTEIANSIMVHMLKYKKLNAK